MFAIRELFQQKNKLFDFHKAFVKEFKKKVRIRNHEGCSIGQEYTYAILFQDLSGNWNSTSYLKQEEDFAFVDTILTKIDIHFIYNTEDVSEYTLETIFERRRFDIEHLNRIKELIYTENNFYAFDYLMKYHPNEFENIKSEYLKDNFSSRRFNIMKYPHSFQELLRYSIKTSNKGLETNLRKQYDRLADKERIDWIMSTLNSRH